MAIKNDLRPAVVRDEHEVVPDAGTRALERLIRRCDGQLATLKGRPMESLADLQIASLRVYECARLAASGVLDEWPVVRGRSLAPSARRGDVALAEVQRQLQESLEAASGGNPGYYDQERWVLYRALRGAVRVVAGERRHQAWSRRCRHGDTRRGARAGVE